MYLLRYTLHFNDIIVYLGKLHASLIRYCDQCDSILMRMVLVAMRMLIAVYVVDISLATSCYG